MNDIRQWLRDVNFPEDQFPDILSGGYAFAQSPVERPWWDNILDTAGLVWVPTRVYLWLPTDTDLPTLKDWQCLGWYAEQERAGMRVIFQRK